jgi:acyl-CoA dehydrogenase
MAPDWPFFAQRHRDLIARLDDWRPVPAAEGPRPVLLRLAEAGLLAAAIPADTDPIDCRALFLLRQQLARIDPAADRALVVQARGALVLRLAGAPHHQPRLDAARRGDWLIGLTEPDGGATGSAEPDGDDYLITGSLRLPFDAQADGAVMFSGLLAGQPQPSAFLITCDMPEFAAADAAPFRLERCRVPGTALIGAPGDATRLAIAARELFGASAAAAAVGLAQAVLDRLAVRLADRASFGRRLLSYQEAQARLADVATRVDAAELLAYRAAWARDENDARMPRESSMARVWAFATAEAAIEQAEGVLADAPSWLDALHRQWREIAAAYDRDVELLLLAGQTVNLLHPAADGWRGRPRAAAR